jgi:hypothetical protein
LWALSQEISRSVDEILRRIRRIPPDMRQEPLRVARELMSAQAHVLDQLTHLSATDASVAAQHPSLAQPVPMAIDDHRAVSTWIDQGVHAPSQGFHDAGQHDLVHRGMAQIFPTSEAYEGSGAPSPAAWPPTGNPPYSTHHAIRGAFVAFVETSGLPKNAYDARFNRQVVAQPAPNAEWLEAEAAEVEPQASNRLSRLFERFFEIRTISISAIAAVCTAAILAAGLTFWPFASGRRPSQPPHDAKLADRLSPNLPERDIEVPQSPPGAIAIAPPPADPSDGEASNSSSGGIREASDDPSPVIVPTPLKAHQSHPNFSSPRTPEVSEAPAHAPPKPLVAARAVEEAPDPAQEPKPRPPKAMAKKPAPAEPQSDRSASLPAAKREATTAQPAWKTAVVTPPAAPVGRYVPMLIELKDASAAKEIFADLQQRHPAVLSNKTAEIKSFTGSDGETWYHVVVLPVASEAEAIALCRSLGSEGEALDCRATPY